MKKIQIRNEQEIMNALMCGRMVEGRLALVTTDDNLKAIEFVAYNRNPRSRRKDKLLCYLEHGWVKESVKRIKVFESLPKRIGALRVVEALEREMAQAANEIEERELFDE